MISFICGLTLGIFVGGIIVAVNYDEVIKKLGEDK